MRYRNRLSPLVWLAGFTAGCTAPDKKTTVAPFCPTTWNAHLPPARTARVEPTVTQPTVMTRLARLPVVVIVRDDPGPPMSESKASDKILQASLAQIQLPPPTLVEDREVVWTAVTGP